MIEELIVAVIDAAMRAGEWGCDPDARNDLREAEAALRARIEELEEAARWWPTREKLPAKYDWYMTRVRFYRIVRSLYFDGRDWIDENEEAVKNVTHWKELPKEAK